jgi:multidrug resistance efflux pump
MNNESQERSQQTFFARNQKAVVALVVLVLCGLVGYMVVDSQRDKGEDKKVMVSGRIEAPDTYIAAATGSRVQSVSVKEGDHVRKGQSIVTLDSGALNTRIALSGTAIAQAQSARAQAQGQIAAANQRIEAARAKSKGFFAKIFGSKKKKEQQRAELKQEMMEAQSLMARAQEGLLRAQAVKAEASSKLSYFYIKSPIDGVCSVRSVEPGEVVAAGQVLLTISDPKGIFMKGYVPEGKISRVKVGQKALVALDSSAGTTRLPAHIVQIDSAPSFTPENIYFKEDRVRQVFGLKLAIDKVDGTAKPGMSAEAEILPAGSSAGK